MSEQTDGIDDAFEATLRIGLTVAGQIAERLAREREDAARHAQAASEQEARQLQGRLDAERAAARASLTCIERAEWWEQARPEQISDAWQTAQAFRDVDPTAAHATERIATKFRERYGIDVHDLHADPDAVRQALAEHAAAHHASSAAQAEATHMLRDAIHERGARPPHDADERRKATAEALYDSPERRDQTAEALAERGIPAEAVQARMLADISNAKPTTLATATQPARFRTRDARPAPRPQTRRVDLSR